MGRLILLIFLCIPSMLSAGAWPRGKGNLYLDLSFYAYPQDHDTRGITPHIYLEYGITDKMTFALDGLYLNDHGMFSGIASITTPIAFKNERIKLAYGFGYGSVPFHYQEMDEEYDLINGMRILVSETITQHTKRQTVTQFSAHFGMGFKRDWLSVDVYVLMYSASADPLLKLDVTYGRSFSDRLTGHIQIQYGAQGPSEYLNLAPNLNWKFSDWGAVNFGASYDTISGYQGLKLGTVLQF